MHTIIAKKKQILLTDAERLQLEAGYKHGSDHRFRVRCRAILLKSEKLSNEQVAQKLDVATPSVFNWTKRYAKDGINVLKTRPGQGRKPIMDCSDEALVWDAVSRERQSVKSAKALWENASGKTASDIAFKRFFRSSGARYKRIPKRPRVTLSPQLYAIKREKLQELENLSNQGLIDLYFGGESHVCTQGYVPYGWQFPGENVFVPSMKSARLNIFGMISRENVYHGFTSRQSIKAENMAEFIDNFSLTITRPTFIVLDNASVHTGGKMKEMIEKWRRRGLYIFYLPPYSPHLNIAETLWKILKTQWIKPCHYIDTSTLFNATHEILDGIGEKY